MAIHFARGAITSASSGSSRLNAATQLYAAKLPPHRRCRYLASRSLLADLLFMLYGMRQLPEIVLSTSGRPHFADPALPEFSVAYAGNIAGVMLAPEGHCGLDMRLQGNFAASSMPRSYTSSGNEVIWANNQPDPNEARGQLYTLRQSVLKMTGMPTTALQMLPVSGRLKMDNMTHIETISDIEDVLIWACAATPGISGLHLWAKDNYQGWKRLTDLQSRCQRPGSRVIRLTSINSDATMPFPSRSQQR